MSTCANSQTCVDFFDYQSSAIEALPQSKASPTITRRLDTSAASLHRTTTLGAGRSPRSAPFFVRNPFLFHPQTSFCPCRRGARRLGSLARLRDAERVLLQCDDHECHITAGADWMTSPASRPLFGCRRRSAPLVRDRGPHTGGWSISQPIIRPDPKVKYRAKRHQKAGR